ncbi:FAD-dependent oxidoreductase [Mesorhizobium sp.]|uniref:FAD-dependent oxidoreductase n=1 Tax=Mesorhizobium sp. TaxID=1871066 RepID=UPI0033907183
MTDGGDVLDAVVIGAGWAGLGVSYWLARRGLRHSVLERGRIGELAHTAMGFVSDEYSQRPDRHAGRLL